MAKNKPKKIFFSLIAFMQIFSLTFGNFFVAQAGAPDVDPAEMTSDAFDELLGLLGIKSDTAEDGGSSANVSANKGGQSVPSVSVMFSPTAPKSGEKATAIAIPMNFSNDKEQLYFTWFLKRKGCDVRPDEYDPDDENSYEAEDYLSGTLEEGATRTQKECDLDGDNMISVNDWKVEAGRAIVQNGFIPDVSPSAKYQSRAAFYATDTDNDGYQAWQGGADAERMPSHCYVYHPTTGLNYELAVRPFGSPMCLSGNEKPFSAANPEPYAVHCGENKTYTTTEAAYDWGDSGINYSSLHYGAGDTVAYETCDAVSDVPATGTDHHAGDATCRFESWDCCCNAWDGDGNCSSSGGNSCGSVCNNIGNPNGHNYGLQRTSGVCCQDSASVNGEGIDPSKGSGWHKDREPQTDFTACADAPNITAECVETSAGYVAICGEDNDRDGLSDELSADGSRRYVPLCLKTTRWYDKGLKYDAYSSGGAKDTWPTVASLSEYLAEVGGSLDGSNLSGSDSYYYYINHCKHGADWGKPLSLSMYPEMATSNDCDGAGERLSNDHFPSVKCENFWTEGDTQPKADYSFELDSRNVPFVGDVNPFTGNENPVCSDRSATENDLLCGSGKTVARDSEDQFHLFPQKLDGSFDANEKYTATESYYELTRDYSGNLSEGEFEYRTGNTTGDKITGFDAIEERFWGTDPRNPSTAGNGKADESNLAGVGLDEFTWVYEEGDEVGVAIEGTSTLPTKFEDSSRMIFWAFSQGVVSVTDEEKKDEAACQPKLAGRYTPARERIGAPPPPPFPGKKKDISIPVASIDFDKCLAVSTIPIVAGGGMNGSQPKAMEVEISATPDSPLNDETGDGAGDTLNAQAIVVGAIGSDSDLTYDWKIQYFKPSGPTNKPTERDWTNAGVVCSKTDPAGGCSLLDEKGNKLKMAGLGLKGINFKLNLQPGSTPDIYNQLFNSDGEGYLKLSVEVRESATDSEDLNSRIGRGSTVVKVSSTGNQIEAFLPDVVGTGLANNIANEICTLGDEKKVCPVIKNQIIGLRTPTNTKGESFTEFSWFLNGQPINNCDTSVSADCANNKSTGFTYVPVTDSGDKTFSVSVKASNLAGTGTGTGKKVELSRNFKVVEPSVKIVPNGAPASGSGAWKKLLGAVTDPTKAVGEDGQSVSDYSESILETATGNAVTLGLAYTPAYIAPSYFTSDISPISDEKWQIEGVSTANPQFTAGVIGTVHNASASAVYTQPREVLSILKQNFGVSISEMAPQTLSHSVQIEVNKEAGAISLKKTTRFLANLVSKIPQQVLFMLRLLISVGGMLILVGAIFSFFPEMAYDERRRQ